MAGQMVRFVAAGILNTALTYIIYVCLMQFASYRTAYTVAFLFGVGLAAIVYPKAVFAQGLTLVSGCGALVAYCLSYLVGLGVLFVLVEYLRISPELAALVGLPIIVPVNFFMFRFVLGHARRRNYGS